MDKYEILVLSGGGIKGISFIGALKALEEKINVSNIKTFAGTSIGAIIACMILLGYTATELYNLIYEYDLTKIKSINITNIINNFYIDDGINLYNFIEFLIKKKNIDPKITLIELYKLTNKRLIVTTFCLNNPIQPIYIWYKNYPNMELLTCLKMTSALMPYYNYIEYEGKLYGDGGYLDNYPIKIFKNELNKVLGLYILENIQEMTNNDITKNHLTYFSRLIECFRNGINLNCLKGFDKYTIKINLTLFNIIDYNIDNNKKKELYDIGYNSVINSPLIKSLDTNIEKIEILNV